MSPSAQVLPTVRLLLPCGEAYFIQDDGVWVIRDPWPAVTLPQDATFPFKLDEAWIYAELVGGRGVAELAVEFLQVLDDGIGGGTRRSIRSGPIRQIDCSAQHPLIPIQTTFRLKKVPFRAEGRYEFRVIAAAGGELRALNGQTAIISVIDTRRTA